MGFDPKFHASKYYESIKFSDGNKYPRLKAWEFLYEYIWDPEKTWESLLSGNSREVTALHLGFYLANWGMFRGSSKLLRNSNLDLMKDVVDLLFGELGQELFELAMVDFRSSAPDVEKNQALLDEMFGAFGGLTAGVSWTDTLKSKIMLGVWGEFPALDRFYIAGCRAAFPGRRYMTEASGRGLTSLADLVEERSYSAAPFTTSNLGLEYPTARFMDMALFNYGKGD